MQATENAQQLTSRRNAIGFVRLVLASLVIVSHTPEIIDGDRRREPLTALFHTLSFGELAVDGFFVVSGFLITVSFLDSASARSFLIKRIARIYPAFVVSSLVCVLLVAPAAGGRFSHGMLRSLAGVVGRLLMLSPPYVSDVFANTSYSVLNNPAWTIQYEFLCYLIVLALGLIGVLRSFAVVAGLAALCLLSNLMFLHGGGHPTALANYGLIFEGASGDLTRLLGVFLVGSAFALKRNKITFSRTSTIMCVVLTVLCLSSKAYAHAGFAVFGGYVLLAFSTLSKDTILADINNRNDISYGLYLYAWPVEKLILWWAPLLNIFVVGLITWTCAALAGAISWFLLEQPVLRWARRFTIRRSPELNARLL